MPPVISGCALAQAVAVVWLVKKLMCLQQVAAAGPLHAVAMCPAKTTAVSGSHTALFPLTATEIGSPVAGSADLIRTFVVSISDMPRASMAHMEYALAPPVIWAVCGVAVAENG